MATKILLIAPPFNPERFLEKDFFSKGKQAPLFPFGIAYIASYLLIYGHGYEVEILDIYARQLTKEEVITELKKTEYDFTGISALVSQYEYVKWLSEAIKSIHNVPVILGNGLGTASHKLVLEKNSSIDVCVRGEGEITFKEVIENIDNLENVLGISYRDDNGKIVITPDRPVQKNIDEFPWPAYELFDMSLYIDTKFYETGIFNVRDKYLGKRILPFITSRGCPYNCNFCGKIIPTVRLRSIRDIVKEIEYLKDNYHIDGIHFIDELVVINKKRAIALSEALKSMNLLWDCQGRVNTVDYETLKIMKESGCVAIGYGVESGSQKILDNMNKRTTVEQVEEAMKAAKKADLDVKVQLIFGYPGENFKSLEETVNIFKKVGHPGRGFSFICPLPGTTLYNYALNTGLIQDEEEFLYKIQESFDHNIPVINFTDFDFDDLVPLMKKCELKMLMIYGRYLFLHPLELIKLSKKYDFSGIFRKLLIRGIPYIMPYIKHSINIKRVFKRKAIDYKKTNYK